MWPFSDDISLSPCLCCRLSAIPRGPPHLWVRKRKPLLTSLQKTADSRKMIFTLDFHLTIGVLPSSWTHSRSCHVGGLSQTSPPTMFTLRPTCPLLFLQVGFFWGGVPTCAYCPCGAFHVFFCWGGLLLYPLSARILQPPSRAVPPPCLNVSETNRMAAFSI